MFDHLKVAVAGTGFIGPVHVEALKRLGVHVKGIMGSTPKKSEAARERWGLSTAYHSFDEIINDPELDAVHLAVPNVLHFSMAKAALNAGKHVMCEKPLAMNSKETAELVALAESTGLVAAVTYNIRFYPLNLEARHMIRQDELGRIFSVVGSYVQDWLLFDTDYNWRVLAEKGGALRAVADIGTHWMDLVTSITGLEVAQVFADLSTVHSVRKKPKGEIETFSGKSENKEFEEIPIETEDCGSILFKFKQGGQGVLWVSQVTAGRKNSVRYEISGAQKSISWNSERPNELWIGHREQANQILVKDPSLVSEFTAPFVDYPGGHHEGFPDTFKQCFKAFYNAIISETADDKALYPTFSEGHKEVALCEAILTSHQKKHWVSLQ